MGEMKMDELVRAFWHALSRDVQDIFKRALVARGLLQSELANLLGLTRGRVTRILNDDTISLRHVVLLARTLGMKVGLLVYEDPKDPANVLGPVRPDVLIRCWRVLGCPRSFSEIARAAKALK
jgi:transcriptional regulator with XRE-family HTH domain